MNSLQDHPNNYKIQTLIPGGHAKVFGLPFTMEELLPIVAPDKKVIVTGVSFIYRDVLMNFVCNLRRLGIYNQVSGFV